MLESIRRSAESWGVKILFGLIILVFVFWGVGSYQGNKAQVIATVNERPILIQDFVQTLNRTMDDIRRRNPTASSEDLKALGIKPQILSQMINDELLREEAARLHITASPLEIAQQIRSYQVFYNEEGAFDSSRYRTILASQNMSPAQFEESIRAGIITQKLRQFVTLPAVVDDQEAKDLFRYSGEQRSIDYVYVKAETYTASITPSQEQIEAFYEKNKDAYKLPVRLELAYLDFSPDALVSKVSVSPEEIEAYYQANKNGYVEPEKVHGRHILIRVPDNAAPAEDEAAKAKIVEIIEKVNNGAEFAALAKELSDDPTRDQGGDLGWVERGEMVDSFEEQLFNTAPGKLSEPVRTPFGWHVILVEERKDAVQQPLDAVRDEIRKLIAVSKAADTLTDSLDQALEQVIGGESMEKVAASLSLELKKTDLISMRQAGKQLALDDASLERLFSMQQGVVTDTPLATDKGYMLAEVLSVKPEEYQPLDAVRDKVVLAVTNQIAMEKAKKQAEDLAKATQNGGLPADAAAGLKSSEPFGRQGFIQGLGQNPELAEAVFSSVQGDWLPQPYEMGEGYIVAKVAGITPPPDAQWESDKAQWFSFLQQGRENELYKAYIDNLRQQAKIEIVSPDLLQ